MDITQQGVESLPPVPCLKPIVDTVESIKTFITLGQASKKQLEALAQSLEQLSTTLN
jgi:hypothetical protein